jgi:hypothetical protein
MTPQAIMSTPMPNISWMPEFGASLTRVRTPDAQPNDSMRPFWYLVDSVDGEVDFAHLNQQDNSNHIVPGWLPAFEPCGASDASTSASASPSLEESMNLSRFGTPGPSDLCQPIPQTRDDNRAETIVEASQTQKVFVGGIPQNMNLADLYAVFNEFGKVKKAWLQMYHSGNCGGLGLKANIGRKHRGFGFVIFFETHAVDKVLGNQSSKYVFAGDDTWLEVKRAIGRNCVLSLQDLAAASPPAQVPSKPIRTCQGATAALPMTWQFNSATPVVQVPLVPQFPFSTPSFHAYPIIVPRLGGHFVQDVLLETFFGEKPRNNGELEVLLRQAMPESYEE